MTIGKRIPTFGLALAIAVAIELILLMLGGFRFGIGPMGPENGLLFFTHFPAMLFCWYFANAFRPFSGIAFEVAVAILNTLMNGAVLFVLFRWIRNRR